MSAVRRFGGTALAVLVMCLVLWFYGGDLSEYAPRQDGIGLRVALATALYVVVILIGAFAWRLLLISFGQSPQGRSAERQLLLSQIAKYAPGNVGHLLGRAALAKMSGIPGTVAALALVVETGVTVVAGMLTASVCIIAAPDFLAHLLGDGDNVRRLTLLAAGGVAVLLVLAAVPILRKKLRRFEKLEAVKPGHIVMAGALYIASFILLGTSLYLVAGGFGDPANQQWLATVAIFSAAWIAGLVTPGAPGGLGVRESVVAIGLTPFLGAPLAVSVALLHRATSVVGDVLAFGIGWMLPAPRRR